METYEVTFRDSENGNRWFLMFQADNFAHAEEQAIDANETNDEIVKIDKDYA